MTKTMRATASRIALLTALAASAPVAAQNGGLPGTTRGLESFSLPRATPTPSPTPIAVPTPAAPVGLPAAEATPRARPTPRATSRAVAPAPAEEAPLPEPTPTPAPQATPSSVATPTVPVASASPTPIPTVSPTPAAAAVAEAERPGWMLPAALVALVVIGGLVFALRRRRDAAVEEEAYIPIAAAPPPPPPAAAAAPVAAPAPVVPATPAVRPWLGLSVVPVRAGVNMATATADVEVTLTNVGDAPADAVRVGVSLLSARSGQDDELGRLFAQPMGRPAVAPFSLAPGEARTVRVLVTLPRNALNVLDAGGRPMFVPVVAANIVYDRGDGGTGQTAGAFVVGIERPGAAKLGPFWLDGPGRMHDTLGIRPHALSLRS